MPWIKFPRVLLVKANVVRALSRVVEEARYRALATQTSRLSRIYLAGYRCVQQVANFTWPVTQTVRPPGGPLLAYFPPMAFPSQSFSPVVDWYGEPSIHWARVAWHLLLSTLIVLAGVGAVHTALYWFMVFLYLVDYGVACAITVCSSNFIGPHMWIVGWCQEIVTSNWFVAFSVLISVACAPIRAPGFRAFPLLNYASIRTKLRNVVVKSTQVMPVSHSHPNAAADRNASDDAINQLIYSLGYEVYSIQASNRDYERRIAGSVRHLWSMDRSQPERNDPVHAQHIFKMINVDYYIDWVDYLWMAQPFLLYTFTPQDPCGVHQEIQWTTNSDNTISMSVNGGATFRHQLWNYHLDHFDARYPGVTIHYALEAVPVNPHWSIVMLTPRAVSPAPFNQAPQCDLKRMKLYHEVTAMDGEVRPSAMIRTIGGNASLSIGIPGQYSSVRLKPSTEAILLGRLALGKAKFSDLAPVLAVDFNNDIRLAQAIIFSAFPGAQVLPAEHTPFQERDVKASYSRLPTARLIVEEKLTATTICEPVIDSAYSPKRSRANDEWCVQTRVDAIHNERIEFLPRYNSYAIEFLRLLIPIPFCEAPVELQDVVDSQKRPTQRANNFAALPKLGDFLDMPALTVRSFQKNELYAAMKDPRNISTLPSEHCLLYSRYTQAFARILKRQRWYAFGMHPDDVAERVHFVASSAHNLTETDFSRFDGTHSHALYDLELTALLRAFAPCEHDMIRAIHSSMTQAMARTGCGVSYDPDGSRLSGAADTSIMNSLDNAYVAYCAFRQMGYTPEHAYASLGIYGGDDGLTPDVDPDAAERVAKDLGLKLKATTVPAVKRVTFLGRIYTNPKGHPGHMADLPRQLPKLHMVASRDPAVIAHAVYNKATGHLVTDSSTPILSHWANMMLRYTRRRAHIADERHWSWTAREYGASKYVPPYAEMLEEAATSLGLDASTVERYCAYLDSFDGMEYPCIDTIMEVPRELPPPGVVAGIEYTILPTPKPTHCQHGCGQPTCEHRASDLKDISKVCVGCSGVFTFTIKEQVKALSYSGNYFEAKRCMPCRLKRKSEIAARAAGSLSSGADETKRSVPNRPPSAAPSVVPPAVKIETKNAFASVVVPHDSPFVARGDGRVPSG
jgi:hypothetical protein